MVIKGEETGNIAVPLGKRDSPAEIKFIVFPDPNHCRHQIDHRGQGINSRTQSPGFDWIFTEFLVEPVPIHDMEIGFVCPVAVQVLIGFGPVSIPMDWILIGTGSDLKAKVEQSLGIMLSV